MRPSRITWGVIVGSGTTLEVWAVLMGHDDWTLSPHLRWLLRCHTKGGAAVTTVLVGGGAAWLAHHLREIPPPV